MNIEPKAMAGDIPVYCSHDEIVDIMKVIPNPKNPNTHGERQIEILSQVIKAQGWRKPITVSKRSGFVVAGHGRLQAALQLQADKVPVDYQDYATEAEEYADLVADNRIAELSEIDHEILNSILEDIKEYEDFNFELTGYSDYDLESILEDMGGLGFEEDTEAVEDDYEVELPKEPKAKLGDIYQLGNHRLMCGDSTKVEDVERLMDGNKADMVFTDPPYGIDYSGGRTQVVKKKEYGKLKNDDLQETELGNLICNVFNFNKSEADVYICVSPIMQKPFLDYIEQQKRKLNAVIVWDKKQPGLGYMAYRRQCEFILFIKGKPFKKGDTTDFDLWSISRDDATTYVHGTQKPIKVPARAITNSSKADDIILDYFGGSGSTLIACEQLKRKCYMMEFDAQYIDVIIDRWEQFTGEKAVLLNAA